MFDFVDNNVISGVVNFIIIAVPAITAFLVGLKKYSSKAYKFIMLAKDSVELIDKIADSGSPDSDGGSKFTAKEISEITKEAMDVKKRWVELKGNDIIKVVK